MMQEENKRPEEELFSSEQTTEENVLDAFEQVAAPQKAAKKKRMSSNTRLLIIVTAIVAVLAILLAVLLPLLSEGTGGSSSSGTASIPEEVYPLYDHSEDKTDQEIVQSVTIKNKDDEYTIRYNKTDKLYQLVGYTDISLSTSGMEELVGCATTLNGYDKVQSVQKLSDFGLEKPSITVSITYHDNSTTTLLIGNETPDKNGYYARLQDGDEVVMINAGTVSYFQLKKGQYVERNLIVAPTIKKDDANGAVILKELTLKGGPGNETLSLRQAATSDGKEYSYASFIITKPYKRMVNDTVTSSLNSFTYLIADEAVVLHPTAADKATYGFNNPYAVIDVTLAVQTAEEETESTEDSSSSELIYYNASTSRITIGSKDANGNYYAMVNDHNAIYLVASSSLATVAERTYVNTISELLFLKNITDLKQVSVSTGDKTYDFMLTHDESKEDSDEQMTVTCDGKTLDTPNFRRLYSRLMGISRYGETDNKKPNGQPLHKLKLIENNGSTFLTLEIFEYTSSLYTVRTDEGELFTVKASDISNFMSLTKDYYNGKPVPEL